MRNMIKITHTERNLHAVKKMNASINGQWLTNAHIIRNSFKKYCLYILKSITNKRTFNFHTTICYIYAIA